jgi:hypothetical protein
VSEQDHLPTSCSYLTSALLAAVANVDNEIKQHSAEVGALREVRFGAVVLWRIRPKHYIFEFFDSTYRD